MRRTSIAPSGSCKTRFRARSACCVLTVDARTSPLSNRTYRCRQSGQCLRRYSSPHCLRLLGCASSQQRRIERLVTAANISIAEPPNEIAAAHAKRSGALQNESAYGVFVFSEAHLNRRRTHWADLPRDASPRRRRAGHWAHQGRAPNGGRNYLKERDGDRCNAVLAAPRCPQTA
jgi:hypothetical protein